MKISNTRLNKQEIIISTIHYENSVVEIYLNESESLISELRYLSNNRVNIFQFTLEDYLNKHNSSILIDSKIKSILQEY